MKQMSHEKTQPLQNFVFLPLQLSSEHDSTLAVSEVTATGTPLELLYIWHLVVPENRIVFGSLKSMENLPNY